MAHFFIPPGTTKKDGYVVDGRLAPDSVGILRIPIADFRDIALWGGEGLQARFDRSDLLAAVDEVNMVVTGYRTFRITPFKEGEATFQTFDSNNWKSVSLQVVGYVGNKEFLTPDCSKALLSAIDSVAGLWGCGVAYVGRNQTKILRQPFNLLPTPTRQPWVVFAEGEEPLTPPGSNSSKPKAQRPTRTRNIESSMADVAVNCGALIFLGFEMAAGVAAAPVSGGTSLIVSAVAVGAAGAALLQCGLAGTQLYLEYKDPGLNDRIDSNETIQDIGAVLDVIQLVDSGFTLFKQRATYKAFQEEVRQTGKSSTQLVREMPANKRGELLTDFRLLGKEELARRTLLEGMHSGLFGDAIAKAVKVKEWRLGGAMAERFLQQVGAVFDVYGAWKSGTFEKIEVYIVEGVRRFVAPPSYTHTYETW